MALLRRTGVDDIITIAKMGGGGGGGARLCCSVHLTHWVK